MKNLISRIMMKFKYLYIKNKNNISYIIRYKKCNPKLNISNIKKILFIAHPDDEVVFFFNQLINSNDWLVICMTNGCNKIRRNEFFESMNKLNAQYQLWNFEDGLYSKWDYKKVFKKVMKILNKKNNWDMILTHNIEGEYGHLQHKQLNKYIYQMCSEHNLYTSIPNNILNEDINKLSEEESMEKIKFMKEVYRSQKYIIDEFKVYFEYEGITNLNLTSTTGDN